MAPEIYINQNRNKYGPEVDLWALGVMAYLMLTGSFAFTVNNNNYMRVFMEVTNFNLPNTFSCEARNFVSKLLTTVPAHRMTFKELSTHPFLHHTVNVTVALPSPCGSAEPPVFHVIALTTDALLKIPTTTTSSSSSNNNSPLIPWGDIAAAVYNTLAGWGCPLPPGSTYRDLAIFGCSGACIDPSRDALSLDELKEHTVEALMVFWECRETLFNGTHCPAPVTDVSDLRALVDKAVPQQQPQQGWYAAQNAFAPVAAAGAAAAVVVVADPNMCREVARRGVDFINNLYESRKFAVGQCALAHKCIVLLENACRSRAVLGLEERVRGALRRLERCRKGSAAARAFLYTFVARDTADIIDFNGRSRNILANIEEVRTSFYTYARFDDSWARHNAGLLREIVRILESYAPAFDTEMAVVMDAFTEYWNTLARELAALAEIGALEDVARRIEEADDAVGEEELLEMTAEYSARLSRIMAAFPTWAVRPCSNSSAEGGGGGGEAKSLPSEAVAKEEYKRKIEALKKEKEKLLRENEDLQRKLKAKNTKVK